MSFKGFVAFAAQADPPFSICLFVEWREVMKRLLPVRLGRKRETSWEMPMVSSLVVAMFIEELRSFNQVPIVIKLKVSNDTATPTIGGANNTIYFTRE